MVKSFLFLDSMFKTIMTKYTKIKKSELKVGVCMRLKYACKTDTCSGRDCREVTCLKPALDDLCKAKH